MKKSFLAVAALLLASSAFAQGTVNFNNRTPAGDVRVTRPDGTGMGAGITAALYMGNTMLTPTTTFRTTAASAFFVNPVEVAVPGVPPGGSVALSMRIWETAAGSYEAAVAGAFLWGWSNEFIVTGLGGTPAGGPPIPSPGLSGLEGFCVACPEPSTVALGVLGSAALLLRRRKS